MSTRNADGSVTLSAFDYERLLLMAINNDGLEVQHLLGCIMLAYNVINYPDDPDHEEHKHTFNAVIGDRLRHDLITLASASE
jgi:hypothetical protein